MKIATLLLNYTFVIGLTAVSLPLMVLIGTAIACNSGFPILYKQLRIGKWGKMFTLYKFRTMKLNAETQQTSLKFQNEADGPVFKIRADPRFTSFGRFLSHTGLDELPQLLNVLKGEMALIGPRPLPVGETDKLTARQKKRLQIKPGIISPWILEGYHARSFSDWMMSDLDYIKHKNLRTDAVLLLKTCLLLARFFKNEILETFGRRK